MRHFIPLSFQKGATKVEVPFHHRCTSRQIFGVRKILPKFPQIPKEVFVQLLPTNFLPEIKTSFRCNLQKGHVFLGKSLALFLPGFSRILHRLSANQNFWG